MAAKLTSPMEQLSYEIRFVTPAFLGDAEQNGAWRTPPFKALLRQWWRVAAAKRYNYNVSDLRKEEGQVFGNAWIEDAFCKSAVRIRLERWEEGKLKKAAWPGKDETKLIHPEVTNKEGKKMPVGAELYLGYGPLDYDKLQKRTVLKKNAAIQSAEIATLRLAWPGHEPALHDALQLMHWFGAVGGRSRNGWGSFSLAGNNLAGIDALNQSTPLLQQLSRPLTECLQLDWPHAIGRDAKGLLIWTSKGVHNTWREAMVELAQVKIAFRTATAIKFSKPKGSLDLRHVLAYPVTNHNVSDWEKYKVSWSPNLRNGRLANQLRFKVARTAQDNYIGLAYQLPCGIPRELLNTLKPADQHWVVEQQCAVWQTVHQTLDNEMQRFLR